MGREIWDVGREIQVFLLGLFVSTIIFRASVLSKLVEFIRTTKKI